MDKQNSAETAKPPLEPFAYKVISMGNGYFQLHIMVDDVIISSHMRYA